MCGCTRRPSILGRWWWCGYNSYEYTRVAIVGNTSCASRRRGVVVDGAEPLIMRVVIVDLVGAMGLREKVERMLTHPFTSHMRTPHASDDNNYRTTTPCTRLFLAHLAHLLARPLRDMPRRRPCMSTISTINLLMCSQRQLRYDGDKYSTTSRTPLPPTSPILHRSP